MTKEKQIEEMAFNLIMATSPLGVKDLTKQFDYNTVAKDLYELYGWRKKSEWISVEERLPDNYRAVLVACEYTTIGGGARIAIGSYGGGFWSLADADGTHYLTKYMHAIVTHWMELPEAPKMKGGGDGE